MKPSRIAASDPAHARAPVVALAVFAAALATRLGQIDSSPIYDELYHLFAGRSWVTEGSLALYQGAYERAPLYTILTGELFELVGAATLATARAPNVLFGALLVVAATLWTRRVAGPAAGWLAALLLILWPTGIHLSQLARFYALHGVLFVLSALAAYAAASPTIRPPRRALLAAAAVAGLALAAQFQKTTYVGALSIMVWLGLFVILPHVWRHPRRWAILAAGALAAALATFLSAGLIERLWAEYRDAPWPTDPFAYHRALRELYPVLWPLTPLAALVAIRANPRPAMFCATLFAVCILIHSFAGVKNLRYVYYVTPFLFVIWAMALRAALFVGWAWLRRMADEALSAAAPALARPVAARVVVGGVIAFVFLAQPAFQRSLVLAAGGMAAPRVAASDWTSARDEVERRAAAGDLVIATNELYTLRYLGGFDVVLSNNRLPEMGDGAFSYDPRTGRHLISRGELVGRIADCVASGVLIADRAWWRGARADLPEMLKSLAEADVRLEIDVIGDIVLLGWRLGGEAPAERCEDVPTLRSALSENAPAGS